MRAVIVPRLYLLTVTLAVIAAPQSLRIGSQKALCTQALLCISAL